MARIVITKRIVEQTLNHLRMSGRSGREGIVIWLGWRDGMDLKVTEVYQPLHRARSDYFHIPREGVLSLLEHCRMNRLIAFAQIHSHPFEAFHSLADDKWAITRQLGALSLVLPFFARDTSNETFLDDIVAYVLCEGDKWTRISKNEMRRYLEVIE